MTNDNRFDSQRRNRIERLITRIEEIFFVLILLTIVILGFLPIILRNFFQTGVTWTEPMARQLVLWIALFGASSATVDRKHISIDIVGHFLPSRWKSALRACTGIMAGAICGIMTWISIRFVKEEAQYSSASPIFTSVPEWIFELVLPIGFAILTLRFAIAVWQDAINAIDGFRHPD